MSRDSAHTGAHREYRGTSTARAALTYSSRNQHGKILENRQMAGSTTASNTPRQQGGTGIWPIEAAVEAFEGILFGGGEWLRWSVITIADRPTPTISRQVNQPWLT